MLYLQQYDAFERNDVKLQEDMKHAKALIKKQQAAIAKEEKKEEECTKEANETKVQVLIHRSTFTFKVPSPAQITFFILNFS